MKQFLKGMGPAECALIVSTSCNVFLMAIVSMMGAEVQKACRTANEAATNTMRANDRAFAERAKLLERIRELERGR